MQGDIDRLAGIRYNPSGLVDSDRHLLEFFDWLAELPQSATPKPATNSTGRLSNMRKDTIQESFCAVQGEARQENAVRVYVVFALASFCSYLPTIAADPARDPAHDELIKVRTGLIEAYRKNDVEGILSYCHPKVVVTWQNGEVSKGPEELRAYINKMMTGPNKIVERLTAEPTVDDLSTIHHDDTAISYGRMNDEYLLRDGMNFKLNSRCDASLVKEGERWLIADFHASANVFDNDILRMAVQKTAWWTGGAALMVGIVVGLVGGRLFGRRAKAN